MSGLSANGTTFPDSGGEHVYVQVTDASDIPRAIKVLKQRLMLADLGWIKVSKAGQRLERTVIDGSVGVPERLVFEGPPMLTPPLTQAKREVQSGRGRRHRHG